MRKEVTLSSPFSSANLLLIGPEAAARAFLAPLMPALPPPVVFLDRAAPDLPHRPVGTLIVLNVARLTGDATGSASATAQRRERQRPRGRHLEQDRHLPR